MTNVYHQASCLFLCTAIAMPFFGLNKNEIHDHLVYAPLWSSLIFEPGLIKANRFIATKMAILRWPSFFFILTWHRVTLHSLLGTILRWLLRVTGMNRQKEDTFLASFSSSLHINGYKELNANKISWIDEMNYKEDMFAMDKTLWLWINCDVFD